MALDYAQMVEECRKCKFFNAVLEYIGPGECRRHAPVVMQLDGESNTRFPDTTPTGYCGDFDRK